MSQIKKFREKLGLTQAEFAELAQVRQASISRYEKGERLPRKKQMKMIVRAFRSKGVEFSHDYFFADESNNSQLNKTA